MASSSSILMTMSQPLPATLIPGDGIGPEIVDATLAVLTALGAPFQWDVQIAGLEGVKSAGDPLPPKPIGVGIGGHFRHRVQSEQEKGLHRSVFDGGDAKRSFRAVLLRDMDASKRQRPIAPPP